MAYVIELATRTLILGSAAGVIAFLCREAGILHVSAAGLMGVGAYVVSISCTRIGLTIPVSIVLTIPAGLFAGIALYYLTRRLKGAVMALALLAAGVVLHGAMLSWTGVTGGAMGVANVPGLPDLPAMAMAMAIVVGTLAYWVPRTVSGARIRALRDDEELSEELNLSPGSLRFQLLAGSSILLSVLGGLYALHLRFVDPSSFTLAESIAVLAMALALPLPLAIRGLAGSLVFVALPELLRFVGLPAAAGAQLRQLLFGVILLLVMAQGTLKKTSPVARGRSHV